MNSKEPANGPTTTFAFTSASLGLTKPSASSTLAQNGCMPPNDKLDDATTGFPVRTGEIPAELHEPVVPTSLLAALTSHGPMWLLSVTRQIVLAHFRLRRCDTLGKWVRVRGKVRVRNEGVISIADRVRFRSETATSELVAWKGGKIEIGEGTTINYGTSISAASAVRIGRDCLIGTYVNIMDCNFHNLSDRSWNMEAEPIVIEDGVWLGNRCMIMKGVTVGRGSVVAACSLVTKNVPPYTMVMGVPARVVQHLEAL